MRPSGMDTLVFSLSNLLLTSGLRIGTIFRHQQDIRTANIVEISSKAVEA